MKHFFLAFALLITSNTLFAQNAPTTDIWVYNLKEKKGKVSISKGERITNRVGYDNQPTFYRSDFLLYTSQFDGQTDIIVYNLYEGESMNLTNSSESEYSAQVIGNYDTFGAVRVDSENRQRLWLFHMDGKSKPEVVMEQIEPIGYFAWNNTNDVLAFLLGEPITLIKGNVYEVDDDLIASNVGRTIKLMPGTNDFAFERTEENGEKVIYHLSNDTAEFKKVITKPENAQDWCITGEGTFITSVGTKLLKYNANHDSDWVEMADLGSEASKGITRMAVNQDNKRIAIVINY